MAQVWRTYTIKQLYMYSSPVASNLKVVNKQHLCYYICPAKVAIIVATWLGHLDYRVTWVNFCPGQSGRHTNMPDPNQKYLVTMRIKNCN